MALIHWTEDLKIGIGSIDEQHQKLVAYINELDEVMKHHDKDEIGLVLDKVISYTVEHFEFEEGLMKEANYHLLEPHKKVHIHFIEKVAAFKQRFDAGQDISEELLTMLENWLVMHIRRNDHGYIEAVKAAGLTDYQGSTIVRY